GSPGWGKARREPGLSFDAIARYATGSERPDLVGLQALLALHHGEAHLLPFPQALEALDLDGPEMHEDVLAVFPPDEAEPLRVIEPLHDTFFTLGHLGSLPGTPLHSWTERQWDWRLVAKRAATKSEADRRTVSRWIYRTQATVTAGLDIHSGCNLTRHL